MKTLFYKFFKWMKDHFSLFFAVIFRLHIGGKKNEEESTDHDMEV